MTAELLIGGLRYDLSHADPIVKSIAPINGKVNGKAPKQPAGMDLADLLKMELPSLEFILDPFISEGLQIFAGKPKIGKTTFLRQVLVAANTGGHCFETTAKRVQCAFLCLEEGLSMAKRKFSTIATPEEVAGIQIFFSWPRGDEGVADLRQYLADHPDVRLVVIDSLSRFRAPATKTTPQFEQDYAAIGNLQNIAKDHPGLAIVVIHHTTKANFDDPLDSISGTYGLTAACDGYGVLMRRGDQYRLHWGGRLWDREHNDFELARENGRWVLLGTWDNDTSGVSPVRREIHAAICAEGTITTRGIARRFDISDSTASEHLHCLLRGGLVTKKGTAWTSTTPPSLSNNNRRNRNTKEPKEPKVGKVSVVSGFGTQTQSGSA